jgi:hypothetical protein
MAIMHECSMMSASNMLKNEISMSLLFKMILGLAGELPGHHQNDQDDEMPSRATPVFVGCVDGKDQATCGEHPILA